MQLTLNLLSHFASYNHHVHLPDQSRSIKTTVPEQKKNQLFHLVRAGTQDCH